MTPQTAAFPKTRAEEQRTKSPTPSSGSGKKNCLMGQNKDKNTRRESQNKDPERFMPPFYL